jgi:hypothetical protein
MMYWRSIPGSGRSFTKNAIPGNLAPTKKSASFMKNLMVGAA